MLLRSLLLGWQVLIVHCHFFGYVKACKAGTKLTNYENWLKPRGIEQQSKEKTPKFLQNIADQSAVLLALISIGAKESLAT